MSPGGQVLNGVVILEAGAGAGKEFKCLRAGMLTAISSAGAN